MKKPRNQASAPHDHGFSLVEVVLALGIVAYAVVAIVALFPLALSNFQDSRTASTGAQIVQAIVNEYDRSDLSAVYSFATSGDSSSGRPPGPATGNSTISQTYLIEKRYYDAEGVLIGQLNHDGTPGPVPLGQGVTPVYTANISVGIPWVPSAAQGSTAMMALQIQLKSTSAAGRAAKEYTWFLVNQSELPVGAGCYSN